MVDSSLYQKIYNIHLIPIEKEEIPLIYIDRHLIHEITSPQAFDGLRVKNRTVRQTHKTFATMDHNVSTKTKNINNSSYIARIQMQTLVKNCSEFNIKIYDIHHPYQGIVHVMGPEQGITLPGMTVVCGDSHTATHGAFGALAFGIGTSEIEHVLATQTIRQNQAKSMKIEINGNIPQYISAKDIILSIIGKLGVSIGNGYVIEFCGDVIKNLSMESRMTLCNMSIEMGAKSSLIAPDNITFEYLKNRKFSPKNEKWNQALLFWKTLKSDKNAYFDKYFTFDISNIAPQITWGTNPSQVIAIDQKIPSIESFTDPIKRLCASKALSYMKLKSGMYLSDIKIDKVFIGSCTNSRIEDLRNVAYIVCNKHVASNVQAIIVPGSNMVKLQAEKEGLDKIFIESGFEWRLPGCSMCIAMNDDKLNCGERCASTSNRNFEDRQGKGGLTHLVSPIMAAGAAIAGHFIDIRKMKI